MGSESFSSSGPDISSQKKLYKRWSPPFPYPPVCKLRQWPLLGWIHASKLHMQTQQCNKCKNYPQATPARSIDFPVECYLISEVLCHWAHVHGKCWSSGCISNMSLGLWEWKRQTKAMCLGGMPQTLWFCLAQPHHSMPLFMSMHSSWSLLPNGSAFHYLL
jgi:hypothetical protein